MESQEQIATLGFVDTLEEQSLLEDMLERSKPAYPETSQGFHYLLRTPFRYPPLKWGSRFGRVHEPAIFYGGSSIQVTLAESAYYRLVFWQSMDGIPAKKKIRTEHTLFSAGYDTGFGIRLYSPEFSAYQSALTDPCDYSLCQRLGTAMRNAGVQAFEYRSARDSEKGICVGLFTHQPFTEKVPIDMSSWLCEVTVRGVSFKQVGSNSVKSFPLKQFLVDGEFPLPAVSV